MTQGHTSMDVQNSLKLIDELLQQQGALLQSFDKAYPGVVNAQCAPPVAPSASAPEPSLVARANFMREFGELFKDDKALSMRLDSSRPSTQPESADMHQPQNNARFYSSPEALQTDTPVPPVSIGSVVESEPPQYTGEAQQPMPAEDKGSEPSPALQPSAIQQRAMAVWNQVDRYLEDRQSLPKPTGPAITEKQLQALSKKHLLLMILDLQQKLESLEAEHEKMLLTFLAGHAHGQISGQAVRV